MSILLRNAKTVYRKIGRFHAKIMLAADDLRSIQNKSTSFKESLKRETQREIINNRKRLAWNVNPKDAGLSFAASAGVAVPKPEICNDYTAVIDRIKQSDAALVVKPQSGYGSQNVFVVYATDDIFDIGRFCKLRGLEEMEARMNLCDSKVWTVEPFLASTHDERCPAHDMKFYCFYGEIGLILEVRRHPKIRYCWWWPDGTRVKTGKYNQRLFDGTSFSELEKQWALRLSSQIPAPFMRIDFLLSKDGPVFCEFTPRPGGFDMFPRRLDQYLGEMYLAAEGRLLDDLWDGKDFDSFRNLDTRPRGVLTHSRTDSLSTRWRRQT